jgi:hypothetical protein
MVQVNPKSAVIPLPKQRKKAGGRMEKGEEKTIEPESDRLLTYSSKAARAGAF